MHQKNYSSYIKFFPQPLISTTITRCTADFINLFAIIVDFWHSEYGSKFRHDFQTLDVFKIPSKKNTENIAVNFYTA